VLKNHYRLVISLPDESINAAELKEISAGMVQNIESQLPYHTPNLQINIILNSEQSFWAADHAENKEALSKIYTLFSNVPTE